MRVVISRPDFLAAFALAARVVPTRSPKPILEGIKLVASEDGSYLMATDLEVGVRVRVLGLRAERPGAVMLPRTRFEQILATSSDPELAVEADGDTLVVSGPRAKFQLPSADASLFPDVAEFGAGPALAVASADLRTLVRRTIFATDVESTRYALGGVLAELSPDGLAMIATDGRRLAHATCPAQADEEARIAGLPVTPVKALKLLDRLLDDSSEPARLRFGTSAVQVWTERASVHSRLVEGRFPAWRDVFPKSEPVVARVAAGAFRAAIEQAAIVTSEESRGVDFAFSAGSLRLSGQAADVGSSKVETAVSYEGADRVVTFDARYLTDFLKVLGPEEEVAVELYSEKDGVVFRSGPSFTWVVMPLTKDR